MQRIYARSKYEKLDLVPSDNNVSYRTARTLVWASLALSFLKLGKSSAAPLSCFRYILWPLHTRVAQSRGSRPIASPLLTRTLVGTRWKETQDPAPPSTRLLNILLPGRCMGALMNVENHGPGSELRVGVSGGGSR